MRGIAVGLAVGGLIFSAVAFVISQVTGRPVYRPGTYGILLGASLVGGVLLSVVLLTES